MKVSFVYDRINKFGGAERILLALHALWPEAPLYTSVYDEQNASWANVFTKVYTSFLQNIPFGKANHEFLPQFMPMAFESFDFGDYDLVISLTSESAKSIITKPGTLHICYCLTPTRYIWSGYFNYKKNLKYGIFTSPVKSIFPLITRKIRNNDFIEAKRPDYYLSISNNVSKRIKKYYRQESELIYPPVDLTKFPLSNINGNYFLIVSRLVLYKNIDLVIKSFNKLNWPLYIIGTGREEGYLKNLAGKNITFITKNLTDNELLSYYQNCRAVIFPGEEDLGLVPIEAQAVGKPVIANGSGGALETVIEGITGEFFSARNEESLTDTLRLFAKRHYNNKKCRENAIRFDISNFNLKFKRLVESKVKN